jgi:hypothetical protein
LPSGHAISFLVIPAGMTKENMARREVAGLRRYHAGADQDGGKW